MLFLISKIRICTNWQTLKCYMNKNATALNYILIYSTWGKTNMLCITKFASSIIHCIKFDQLKNATVKFAVERETGVKWYWIIVQRAITVSRHLGIMWLFNGEMCPSHISQIHKPGFLQYLIKGHGVNVDLCQFAEERIFQCFNETKKLFPH